MIRNGDFSQGEEYWNLERISGAGSHSVAYRRLCITPAAYYDLSYRAGYPLDSADAVALEAGVNYTLSYRVTGSGRIRVKVGQAVAPWTAVMETDDYWVSDVDNQRQMHTVMSPSGEAQAGLVFTTYGGEDHLCFSDIELIRTPGL